ncbi:MAG: hypothetical protein AB7U85_05320 [Alphaproteobacteria bacterium]
MANFEEKTEILFEIRNVGNSVKVTAIDPNTGLEATIVAPKNMTMFSLKEQAKRKLIYLLNKKS